MLTFQGEARIACEWGRSQIASRERQKCVKILLESSMKPSILEITFVLKIVTELMNVPGGNYSLQFGGELSSIKNQNTSF